MVYALHVDGAAVGIPPGSNLDMLFVSEEGELIVGFDVPTTIDSTTYDPADLVRLVGGAFTIRFDASEAGIPASVDVTGADERGGAVVMTLDVPASLTTTTYLPGDLVAWDGESFTRFQAEPSWPPASRIDAFAFLADPGEVVDSLRVDLSESVPDALVLSWGAACSSGVEDDAIYEGEIGTWPSHTAIDCSDDGGDRSETIAPGSGNHYYLIVPWHANDEGSYGRDSNGDERARGTETCIATQVISGCP